jgi:hypothetical protein
MRDLQQMKQLKLTQKNCGSRLAVGLHGDKKSITERFNSFWNHGATDGELHWLTNGNAYFWTTEKDLEKAVFNATLFELWNKRPELEEDDKQAEAEAIAKRIAKERLTKIENNPKLLNFNKAVSIANLDCYAMGSITAERPDSDYQNRETL